MQQQKEQQGQEETTGDHLGDLGDDGGDGDGHASEVGDFLVINNNN